MALFPDPWHFPRTALAQQILRVLNTGITPSMTLFAPRRMGKTDFLINDLLPLAEKQGFCVVYLNLWADREHPAGVIINALYKKIHQVAGQKSALSKVLDAKVKKLGFKIQEIGADIEFSQEQQAYPASSHNLVIEVLLATLVEVTKKQQLILLLFDEVQHLATHSKYESLTAALRTALDIRKTKIKSIFTGSSRHGLTRMFHDSRAPFFKSSTEIPFHPLGRAFVEFIANKCKEIDKKGFDVDEAVPLFAALKHSPYYFRELANRVVLYKKSLDQAYQEVLEEITRENRFPEKWSKLKEVDREIFYAIFKKEKIYASEFLNHLAKKMASNITPSMIQNSVKRLIKAGLISDLGSKTYEVEDELFADWVKQLPSSN